jgi:hypothetical protein
VDADLFCVRVVFPRAEQPSFLRHDALRARASSSRGGFVTGSWHARRYIHRRLMKHSVLWVAFFFAGLLVASSRLGDARPTTGSRLARKAVVVHKIKVRVASLDVRLDAGREPGSAPPLHSEESW